VPIYGAALRWKRRSQIYAAQRAPSREKVGTTDRRLERDDRRTVASSRIDEATKPTTSLWSYSAQDLAARAIAASHQGRREEQSAQMSGTRRAEAAFTVASSFFHRIRVRNPATVSGFPIANRDLVLEGSISARSHSPSRLCVVSGTRIWISSPRQRRHRWIR
jgi:hypothetical protein